MRPLRDARDDVLATVPRVGNERVDVAEAIGRVLAEDVIATELVPPFANSAMDGYAIVASDLSQAPVVLTVIEDVPAGSMPTKPVTSGHATRIMTGAPLPEGADAVAMVEITEPVGDTRVRVNEAVEPWTAVRSAGSDVQPGDRIAAAGVRLTPRHMASIASVQGALTVARVPRVAFMSTGDEIVPPATETLLPGKIRDTNRVMLRGLLHELGVPIVDFGIIGDDPVALRSAFTSAASEADIVISTGGVSMGDHDHVKHVLGERGSVQFWRVAMQPAKPFAFGAIDDVPFFGLPGNPVSTFVAFEQFVRPAILSMMGSSALLRPRVLGTIGEDVRTTPDKEVFLRVLLVDDGGRWIAVTSGGQASNVLSGLASADAFAVVPVGVGSLSAGDDVILEMFRWPETRGAHD
jgi:molybdopterin molybdotransferase